MNDLLRDKDYYTQYVTLEVKGFVQTVRVKTIGQPERVYMKDIRPSSILSKFATKEAKTAKNYLKLTDFD